MVQMGGSMLFMLFLCWRLSLVPFIVVPVILVASKIFGVYYDVTRLFYFSAASKCNLEL